MLNAGKQGRSVHIGLNQVDGDKYRDGEGRPWPGLLSTCETDATDMAALAASQGLVATTLLTADATADGICTALRSEAGQLRGGDLFVLTYSGHGGSVADGPDGDEADGRDETWVTYDRQFLDDELFAELTRFAAGVRVLVVSDSCHSGTMSRRQTPPDDATPMLVSPDLGQPKVLPRSVQMAEQARRGGMYEEIQRAVPRAAASAEQLEASVLHFGACQDNQYARVGPVHSVYTGRFLRTWDDGGFQGDYRAFFKAISERMPSDQTPNWAVPGPEDPDFFAERPFTV